MGRRRTPTADELTLWSRAMADTEPLPGREPPPSSEPEPAPREAPSNGSGPVATAAPPGSRHWAPRPPVPAPVPPLLPLDPSRPAGLDRRSWLRLKRGRQQIDASLDLHGLTQAEAHGRLTRFLADAQRRGHRCVLVITGRGLYRGGVLRQMVPRWLGEPPNRGRVLTYSPARLHHGGEGALYLLLRRPPSG